MGRPKFIFFTSFFVFNLLLFLFALYVDANRLNIDVLFALQGQIPYMKYVAALGVGLSIIAFGISFFVNQRHKEEIEKLKSEQRDYKARLYDMQEELKKLRNPELVANSPATPTGKSEKEK